MCVCVYKRVCICARCNVHVLSVAFWTWQNLWSLLLLCCYKVDIFGVSVWQWCSAVLNTGVNFAFGWDTHFTLAAVLTSPPFLFYYFIFSFFKYFSACSFRHFYWWAPLCKTFANVHCVFLSGHTTVSHVFPFLVSDQMCSASARSLKNEFPPTPALSIFHSYFFTILEPFGSLTHCFSSLVPRLAPYNTEPARLVRLIHFFLCFVMYGVQYFGPLWRSS